MYEMFYKEMENLFNKFYKDTAFKYEINSSKTEKSENCCIIQATDALSQSNRADYVNSLIYDRFSANNFIKCCDGECLLMGEAPIKDSNVDLNRQMLFLFERPECGITETHRHGTYNHYHYMCHLKQDDIFYKLKRVLSILADDITKELYHQETDKAEHNRKRAHERRD